jgi:hypothetical protein
MRVTPTIAGWFLAIAGLYLTAALAIGPDDTNAHLCAVVGQLWFDAGTACTTNLGTYALRAAVIVALCCVIALLIDGVIWLRRRNGGRFPTATPETARTQKPTQIIFGIGDSFEEVMHAGVNLSRTVRVKVRNNTDQMISNGKMEVLGLDPPHRGEYSNWLLRESIVIPAMGETFVDVAAYTEGTSKYPPGLQEKLRRLEAREAKRATQQATKPKSRDLFA